MYWVMVVTLHRALMSVQLSVVFHIEYNVIMNEPYFVVLLHLYVHFYDVIMPRWAEPRGIL